MASDALLPSVLFKCIFLLCLCTCLCQRDCTGVDCPMLQHCIEEVLDTGACCATCVQAGCMCEGYQYYDCIQAGFRNGKVPEGKSYFVDFGSTECSCPLGGGRISCHFIPCPEVPPNCIDISQPADGCMQCERIGCVHHGQKFEAGHTFRMDSCQVCHCPNDGGSLMCYPVPECDPRRIQNPNPAITAEGYIDPQIFDEEGKEHFSRPYHVMTDGKLPLFKEKLHHMAEEEEEGEEDDYDYSPTDSPKTYLAQAALPPEPALISMPHSESNLFQDRLDENIKKELRQTFGSRKVVTNKEEITDSPYVLNKTTQKLQETTASHKVNQETQIPQGADQLVLLKDVRKDVSYVMDHEHKSTHNIHLKKTGSGPDDNDMSYVIDHRHKNTHNVHLKENVSSPNEKVVPFVVDHEHKNRHNFHLKEKASNTNEKDVSFVTNREQHEPKNTHNVHLKETASVPDEKRGLVLVDQEHISLHNDHLKEKTSGPTEKNVLFAAAHDPKTTHTSQVTEQHSTFTRNESLEPDHEHRKMHRGHVVESNTDSGWHEEHFSSPGEPTTSGHETERFLTVTTPPDTPEHSTQTTTRPSPTSKMPVETETDGKRPLERQLQTHHTYQTAGGNNHSAPHAVPQQHKGAPASELLEACCKEGQKWASDNNGCTGIHVSREDTHSICRTAQEQCCLGVLKENSCLAGMNAAKGGDLCQVDGDTCGNDSFRECCSCCSLGLQFRSMGHGCEAHRHLSHSCGNVFLTCCEDDYSPSQPALRRKQRPQPTVQPDRVSDNKFAIEPFSMRDPEEVANSVEEPEDLDECQIYEGQLCHHRCINTWGSYECACFPGYKLLLDGHICVPENLDNRVAEELETLKETAHTQGTAQPTQPTLINVNPCEGNGPCAHVCSAEGDHARCSCFAGFSLMANGQMCEDVDECSTDVHNCSHEEFCVNTAGSFNCVHLTEPCGEGFIRNQDGECADVDECITNTHSCQSSERCLNTVGSFVCERQETCPLGYELQHGVCEDVNECSAGTHSCEVGFECQNTDGSFFCQPKPRCFTGFTQDSHGNCVDVDECRSLEEPCSSGFNCVNTVGSYTCQRKVVLCSQGYRTSEDGARCVDVDECQVGSHRCSEGQICHNLPGSYRCDCQTGYQYDMIRRVCVDVNECWRYPGRLCAQTCENTPGSYHCTCTAGFTLATDGKNCEDVNECHNNPCSQECANIYGSYQCYCRQGFYLKEDGHTCEDIDECSQNMAHLCAFQCVNVPGSYQCACPPHGYSMSPNGRTCRDVDECAIGAHNCSASETCYNIQGGFRCLSFSCPQNYRRVSDTRCERTSCPSFLDCQNSPLRITYYQLSFQTNTLIPAQIFRIGPSPAYSGDNIIISITRGNEENYFSTRKLNAFTGAVYLQRQVREPRDFLIDVEMKLFRQGTFTTFLARIYVFITAHSL